MFPTSRKQYCCGWSGLAVWFLLEQNKQLFIAASGALDPEAGLDTEISFSSMRPLLPARIDTDIDSPESTKKDPKGEQLTNKVFALFI